MCQWLKRASWGYKENTFILQLRSGPAKQQASLHQVHRALVELNVIHELPTGAKLSRHQNFQSSSFLSKEIFPVCLLSKQKIKTRRRNISKISIHCQLFTDMLLGQQSLVLVTGCTMKCPKDKFLYCQE